MFIINARRHSQVVRHGSATPLSPVQVWVAPPRKKSLLSTQTKVTFLNDVCLTANDDAYANDVSFGNDVGFA